MRLLDQRIDMFEFTHLGAILLLVGASYLMLAAAYLLAERRTAGDGYVEDFAVGPYLSEVRITDDSPHLGQSVEQWLDETGLDLDVLSLIRGEDV